MASLQSRLEAAHAHRSKLDQIRDSKAADTIKALKAEIDDLQKEIVTKDKTIGDLKEVVDGVKTMCPKLNEKYDVLPYDLRRTINV
ncbi:hypothetical protein OC844_008007 [Tilletia horrida]|nr:hypothetical protein OC844_008007 [Tilletia horrida]